VAAPNSDLDSPGGEDGALARIEAICASAGGIPPAEEIWIGDDAAYAAVPGDGRVPGARILLATDVAVEGVHGDLTLMSPADLGWRAVMATVSDIAAMGGRPTQVLVGLCVPRGTQPDEAMRGAADAAAACGVPVVGGDLTVACEVVVSVAVVGILEPGPDGLGPITRSGAEPGDQLLVTGVLGGSAAGLRELRASRTPEDGSRSESAHDLVRAHRRPRARVAEGAAARAAGVSAMIDVSDGLGRDLDRLARASGVGVALDGAPVAPGATEAEAIGGGEDYELIIATPNPDRVAAMFAARDLRPPLPIGRCVEDLRERSLRGHPLDVTGYRHHVV